MSPSRTHADGRWTFSHDQKIKTNLGVNGRVRRLSYGGVDFESRDTVGNVFANGAYRIMKKAGGYRWLEKDGSWIDVSAGGQIVASGHRARTIVRYVYNAADQLLRVTNDAGDQNYVTFPDRPLPVLAPERVQKGSAVIC